MKSLTRRTFLKTSGMGTGLGILAAVGASKDAFAQADPGSSITSNFNGTRIAAGDFIWFNSVLKVQGLGSDPVTIGTLNRAPSARQTFVGDSSASSTTSVRCIPI